MKNIITDYAVKLIKANPLLVSEFAAPFWSHNEEYGDAELVLDESTMSIILTRLMNSTTLKLGAGEETADGEKVREAIQEVIMVTDNADLREGVLVV